MFLLSELMSKNSLFVIFSLLTDGALLMLGVEASLRVSDTSNLLSSDSLNFPNLFCGNRDSSSEKNRWDSCFVVEPAWF